MQLRLILFCLLCLCTQQLTAQDASTQNKTKLVIDKWINHPIHFDSLQKKVAALPEGAVTLMLMALRQLVADAEVGKQLINKCIHPEKLTQTRKYDKPSLRTTEIEFIRLQVSPQIVESYLQDTAARNLQFEFVQTQPDTLPNTIQKVYIYNRKNPLPVAVQVKKGKDNLWRMYEWGGLLVNHIEVKQEER